MSPNSFPTVCVRGLNYLDTDRSGLAALLRKHLNTPAPTVIFTPNAKIGGDARRDPSLHTLLEKGDVLLPDGAGVLLASRLHASRPLTHRLPGIEAGEITLALASEEGHPVYFLGGKPGVAEEAAARWQAQLPTLAIAGTHHGYFATEEEQEEVVREIQKSGAQIVLVCLGFPAQERWIIRNKDILPSVRLFMGLGGSFDVWSGDVRRAPALFCALRAEWLWRMLCEPRRFVQFPTLVGYVFGR